MIDPNQELSSRTEQVRTLQEELISACDEYIRLTAEVTGADAYTKRLWLGRIGCGLLAKDVLSGELENESGSLRVSRAEITFRAFGFRVGRIREVYKLEDRPITEDDEWGSVLIAEVGDYEPMKLGNYRYFKGLLEVGLEHARTLREQQSDEQ